MVVHLMLIRTFGAEKRTGADWEEDCGKVNEACRRTDGCAMKGVAKILRLCLCAIKMEGSSSSWTDPNWQTRKVTEYWLTDGSVFVSFCFSTELNFLFLMRRWLHGNKKSLRSMFWRRGNWRENANNSLDCPISSAGLVLCGVEWNNGKGVL